MKYKRVLILVTILFFVTVSIFASAMLFTVNEIEIKADVIASSGEGVQSKAETVLSSYKGKNYIFTDTNKIANEVQKSSPYVKVVSVNKVFPNKIVVEIKERKEALCLVYDSKYYVLDEELVILKISNSNENNVDGLKNVELNLNVADYGQAELAVGAKLNVYDQTAFSYLKNSVTKFVENRQNLESVTLEVKRDGNVYNRLTLAMREGVKFRIQKANEETLEKLDKAFEFYSNLTMPNGNKGEGDYFVFKLESSGDVVVSKA
ncbi:MAG: FtsQ-type POTRA domain-containing protein [Clostridia bacterium]|nr:FtsQ-type POTRA domain-containing protein [Clostridia bacterium]